MARHRGLLNAALHVEAIRNAGGDSVTAYQRTYVTAFQDEVTALQPISGSACAKAVESARSEGRGEAAKDGSGVSDR